MNQYKFLKRGFEYGYGVYECADGRVYKGEWKENKCIEKALLLARWQTVKGRVEKLESSMDFSLRPYRILNKDFCMVQMDYQTRQMKNPTDDFFMLE